MLPLHRPGANKSILGLSINASAAIISVFYTGIAQQEWKMTMHVISQQLLGGEA